MTKERGTAAVYCKFCQNEIKKRPGFARECCEEGAKFDADRGQPREAMTTTAPAPIGISPCPAHMPELRNQASLPCPWCVIDELKETNAKLRSSLTAGERRIDALEAALRLFYFGTMYADLPSEHDHARELMPELTNE